MSLTIDLPDELAARLIVLLPEEAREPFAVSAIAEALLAQESDSADCADAIEEAFADMEAGRSVTLEEEKAGWQSQRATRRTKQSAWRECVASNILPRHL